MTELVIRNHDIKKKLEYVRSTVWSSKAINSEYYTPRLKFKPDDADKDGEKYLSEEWLHKNMNDDNHQGFPMEHCSLPMQGSTKDDPLIEEIYRYSRENFIYELGANSSAVFLFYPPGGFVGWHTNQNNSGYQFIFTYSEKGNGYFQYRDPQTENIIVTKDQPGWRCHYHHFGEAKEDLLWHSAFAYEPRITVCVLFRWWDKPQLKDQVLAMKDQLIEEIQSEE
tara:strand:+ start:449 stop:1120 length:672 start_codon:yes stop_codon:yes gene_type:complete